MEEYPHSHSMGVTRERPMRSSPEKMCAKFSPALRLQRYSAVLECLCRVAECEDIRAVTEYGCNSCHFLYSSLRSVPWLEKINQVDVDRNVLDAAAFSMRQPWRSRTQVGRVRPLTAFLYGGSIAGVDSRVADSDAVVAIELIEHLSRKTLRKFPKNVFGQIRPKCAVFTTPNRDFNGFMELKPNGFRHDDHKFEFSRREFRDWAQRIVNRYPAYAYQIYGIGAPPRGTNSDVGYASQMVIFERKTQPVPIYRVPACQTLSLERQPEFQAEAPTTLTATAPEKGPPMPDAAEPVRSYQLVAEIVLNSGDRRTDEEKRLHKIGALSSQIVTAIWLDGFRLVSMRQEHCAENHRMDVVPVEMVVRHLQYRGVDTDAETVTKAVRAWDQHRHDIELTVALGPVFVEESECLSQGHDEMPEYDPYVVAPSSFYRLLVSSNCGDECCLATSSSLPPAADEQPRRRRADDVELRRRTIHFLDAAEVVDFQLICGREACEMNHCMTCVTPEMVVAHLRANGIETDANALLTAWCAVESTKYHMEETSFGYVFMLHSGCGGTACESPPDEEEDEHPILDDDFDD